MADENKKDEQEIEQEKEQPKEEKHVMEKIKDKLSHKDKAKELQSKCDEYLSGWKRSQADYQNLQRETTKEKMDFVRYANANLITELLPVMDNFKAAFKQIPENEKNSAWVVGFSYIKKQMEDFLKNNGVEEIKTVGEKFDPSQHESVASETDEEKEDEIILAEKKAGYRLNGKVIQAARVVVNSKDGKVSENSENSEK